MTTWTLTTQKNTFLRNGRQTEKIIVVGRNLVQMVIPMSKDRGFSCWILIVCAVLAIAFTGLPFLYDSYITWVINL